jgi:DNA-binding SARP family transcriptional activator/pimeloyl-ACP methyl ester carboxylesterase
MEFRILGPLEVLDGTTPVRLGGRRQRALLARLLLDANRTVAVDRLLDDLWGDDVPESGVKMVHIYVWQLRKLLPPGMLVTRSPGYAVELEPEAIDVVRFARLRDEGRAALDRGEPAIAAIRLREALALWRGAALAEFPEPFARAESAHLEDLHLACLEDRIEADLALGRHADLVGELEALVTRLPLRERVRGQLMLALHRSGRHAEALDAYRQFRHAIDEELGLEPSPSLRDIERRILQHDTSLDLPASPDTADEPLPSEPPVPPVAAAGTDGSAFEPRFVNSGDVSIAYQVLGKGPLDLVLVHGWVCSFAAGWERDQIARFYRRLASMGRLILFDKRGTGLSDRVKGIAPLEERMDDVRAVMDAVGSQRAALLGVSEGGPMVSLFAATYPERTAALVAMGTFARRRPGPDYPIDVPNMEANIDEWGLPVARRFVEERAPSVAHDEAAVRWYASYIVRGASPGAAITLRAMNDGIDVRHVLPTIGVPALVLYRADEFLREATRYMGERIPGARVVALPGADHLPWEGDQDDVLDEIEAFLATVREEEGPERVLATVMSTRVASSDPTLLERYRALVRNQLPRFRGTPTEGPADGASASFDGPARAIRCARALVEAAAARGIAVRAGLHTGECALVDGELHGAAVEVSAGVAGLAAPGEVLVSSTVRDLVAGSGISLHEREQELPARTDAALEWRLFSVGAPVATAA